MVDIGPDLAQRPERFLDAGAVHLLQLEGPFLGQSLLDELLLELALSLPQAGGKFRYLRIAHTGSEIQCQRQHRLLGALQGSDDFVDPATMMDLYSNEAVLLDGIPDQSRDNRNYLATVTLPDIECDNCTLQVIQVMYDKPPYITPGNDIYYQCADLVLRAGAGPPDADPGTDTGGGCDVVRGAGTVFGMMPLFLILVSRRLARRRGFLV